MYHVYHVGMDVTRMGTREFRDDLGHRIDAAHYREEPTIIEKNGEPRAVLISYAEWIRASAKEQR